MKVCQNSWVFQEIQENTLKSTHADTVSVNACRLA